MKKINLITVALLFSVTLFGQTVPKLGIKGGLNIATLNFPNDNDDLTDALLGFHVGGLAHVHLTNQWAIQPELLYSGEGMKRTTGNQEVDWKLHYVNIPLLLQYMFDNGFRIEAGPQLGLMISSKRKFENGGEDDIDNVFTTTNVSLGVGLSYLSYSGFGIGGRYNIGLTDIYEGNPEAKSRVFQLSLFYLFDSRHKSKSR